MPPAECIATHIANGATGLHIYGYSGLDDGGVMFRMDELFKDSLRAGNELGSEGDSAPQRAAREGGGGALPR
ncbi:MAG: hypothetical protein QM796_04690 [Chthoniobacteraceae bacterium]